MKLKFWQLFPVLTFVNGIIYVVVCTVAGGSAIHGRIVDGEFYVGSYGKFYEVSEGFYWYSWWHGLFVGANLILLLIVLGVYEISRLKSRS